MLDSVAFLVSFFLIFLSVLLLRFIVEDYVQAYIRRAVRREAQRAQERGIWLPSEQIESLQIRLREHGQQQRQQNDSEGRRDRHAVTAAARR